MLGMGSPLSASSSPPASPSVQAQPGMTMCAYLDVVRNLGDLKQRISQWERGDASSRGIALEKAERLEILFAVTQWPTAQLTAEANVVKNGVEPVRAALEAENLDAAKQAATQVGDHDLTHAFYDWLEPVRGLSTPGARLVGYLDVVRNLGDLKERVARWGAGDGDSRGIAVEKADRLGILFTSIDWPTPRATAEATALKAAVEAVRVALEADDLETTRTLAAQASDHDLTHAMYDDWIGGSGRTAGTELTAAVYLDLVRNIGDLRDRIGQWERGDASSRGIALEKAERLERLFAFLQWPGPVAGTATGLAMTIPPVRVALEAEDLDAALVAVAAVSDHDLTHAFYDWMRGSSDWQ